MMTVLTPKRPTLPPLTPASYRSSSDPSRPVCLPPLLEIIKSIPFALHLPSKHSNSLKISPLTPLVSSTRKRLHPTDDSFDGDDSMDRSSVLSLSSKTSYAFISHSPATFPLQNPTIDNAPLARRRRRRTSPAELAILNSEYEIGRTPNRLRRLDIAARVNMDEKAVQVWFQNKRQHMRKQANQEREVTELPEVSISSTPCKPPYPLGTLQSPPIFGGVVRLLSASLVHASDPETALRTRDPQHVISYPNDHSVSPQSMALHVNPAYALKLTVAPRPDQPFTFKVARQPSSPPSSIKSVSHDNKRHKLQPLPRTALAPISTNALQDAHAVHKDLTWA